MGCMPKVRGDREEGGGVVLTGTDESVRAFVKGMVVGSLIHAKADETVKRVGWKFRINEDGIPIFEAPSGARYAVGVVQLEADG